MTPLRCRALVVATVVGLLAISGCGLLPTSGPVVTDKRDVGATTPPPADFVPPGPGRGDSPDKVVGGFLTALTEVPLGTSTARRFLAAPARNGWHPSSGTIAYTQVQLGRPIQADAGSAAVVRVVLDGVRRFDGQGAWLGGRQTLTLTLRTVRERGQWRVVDPPDAVLVPTWYFDEQYEAQQLWFFDSAYRTLVSERVFLPRSGDLATTLVRALLRGPTGRGGGVGLRTAFPAGTTVDLGVVVRNGLAEVSLRGRFRPPSGARLRQVVAQLGQTVRQVQDVRRMRVLVRDSPLTLPGGRRTVSVDVPPDYDTVGVGTAELYGIRGQRVRVRTGARVETPVAGVFGRPGLALRSLAVRPSRDPGGDPTGAGMAGVGQDGRTVLVGAPARTTATTIRRVYTGVDVLRPSYSLDGSLWLVDRRGAGVGARVALVRGRSWEAVPVPGVSGRSVTAFVVSPDGGSLAAVVGGADGARIAVSRLVRRADGSVLRATPATTLSTTPASSGRVVGLAWHGPQDLAVLRQVPANGTTVSEVGFVSVDGSPGDSALVPPDTWRGAATGLVGSSVEGAPLYLVAGRRLLELDESTARWQPDDVPSGLVAPTYPG